MNKLMIEQKGRSQMKSRNKLRIFREILRKEPISRTQLEKELKLSAPSVTRIVEELIEGRIVRESGTEETGVGRRPILLEINPLAYYSIGIHITKTKLYLCLTDLKNRMVGQHSVSIADVMDGDSFVKVICSGIADVLAGKQLSENCLLGIGIACRGIVDQKNGVVIRYKQGITQIALKALLESLYHCHVYVENNTVIKLLYDYNNHLESRDQDILYLYMDEGIGGSVISNGMIISGEHNMASKIAHLPVEAGGRTCTCGKCGHLEAYLLKSRMEEEYYRRTGNTSVLTLREICEQANRGEETAVWLLDKALDKLAIAMNQMLVLINPGTVVFSGDLFESYKDCIGLLKSKTEQLVFDPLLAEIEWLPDDETKISPEQCAAFLAVEEALDLNRQ